MPTLPDVGDGTVENGNVVLLCEPRQVPESRFTFGRRVGSSRWCLDNTDDRCGCASLFQIRDPLFKLVYANPEGAAVGSAQMVPRM